jgi:hypothetical protein
MKIQIIALSFGYVEEHSISWVLFGKHECEFDSPAAAFEDLAHNLLRAYEPELFEGDEPQECCVATREAISGAKVCATCGTRLNDDELWDDEAFEIWLRDLPRETTNSLGLDFEELSEWTPFVSFDAVAAMPPEEILVVPEMAERHLIRALNPETVPETCREAIRRWWEAWSGSPEEARPRYVAEWNERKFNY